MIPLEKRTVRYIDNFSTGGRGSASAEYFLREGYAVIFLHRTGSLRPFRRLFNDPLALFDLKDGEPIINPEQVNSVRDVMVLYREVVENNALLEVPFTTLTEYLYWVKHISILLHPVGNNALFYSAAAVSDFYVPETLMPTHKMQSADGPPEIKLANVPKTIHTLRTIWAPEIFLVTFKLETNVEIIQKKMNVHLFDYGVDLVIGNILGQQKDKVYLGTKTSTNILERTTQDIEQQLIPAISNEHDKFKTQTP